jgi:hypothetical protein
MLDVQPTVGCQCPMNAATGQKGLSPSCPIHGRGTPEWEECQPECDLCEYEVDPALIDGSVSDIPAHNDEST